MEVMKEGQVELPNVVTYSSRSVDERSAAQDLSAAETAELRNPWVPFGSGAVLLEEQPNSAPLASTPATTPEVRKARRDVRNQGFFACCLQVVKGSRYA